MTRRTETRLAALVQAGSNARGTSAEARGDAAALAALAVVGALSACAPTQRYPGPMETADPLPPSNGAWYEPGPLEVEVWRHSDPVTIRRAGAVGGFPMSYLRKTERVSSGSIVQTAPGGRAEVIWPVTKTAVLLIDEGAVIVTEPERDEPTAVLLTLTHAELSLSPGDEVMLPGGAMVSGDAVEPSGPFHLESRRRGEIVRFENRSKHVASVRYLEQAFEILPMEIVDLPLLSGGTAGKDVPPGSSRLAAGTLAVTTFGEATATARGAAVDVRAAGPARASGLGADVFLSPGDRATFRPLGNAPPAEEPAVDATAAAELPSGAGTADAEAGATPSGEP